MKFVLLLTLWGAETPIVDVLDGGLTGEDCIERLIEEQAKSPIGILSCELDGGE